MRLKTDSINLKELPNKPGVYRFWNKEEQVIYVGKAGILKNRLSSYFRKKLDNKKTQVMVEQATELDYITTLTDNEALLLESNLIKQHKPAYNILFRDDKSYPYIHITDHQFPQIKFHRGKKNNKGSYFGPFASSFAVHNTLKLIQKVFPVRQCDTSFYNNRTRPCLQYQIKRCNAPCVGLVSQKEYQREVLNVKSMLEARNDDLIQTLSNSMQEKSKMMEYEAAAVIRNQIRELQHIREKQNINSQQISHDIDVIAIGELSGKMCIQIMYIRSGWQYGSKTIWAKNQFSGQKKSHVLEAFITQHYQNTPIPNEIVTEIKPRNYELLEAGLTENKNKKVTINFNHRSDRSKWLESAKSNAQLALTRLVNTDKQAYSRMESLKELLNFEKQPSNIECFDISHTMGQHTKGSCVVFHEGKPANSYYRIMNLENITPGDDYAAMKQIITRRYQRLINEKTKLPELIIVDGGKGQGRMAKEILSSLNLEHISLLAVSKGEQRKAGEETLFLPFENNKEIEVSADHEALHLIQYIRDEAHRFAITGHRAKRAKAPFASELDKVEGVGSVIRQRLIQQFGGLNQIKKMGVEDLCQVKGVNIKLAEKIYNFYHE